MNWIGCLTLFCALHLTSIPFLEAGTTGDTILPGEWRPDLTAASEWLEKDLSAMQAQQGMNQLSRCLADLKDAELFAIYVRFFETLGQTERRSLVAEQKRWLIERRKAADKGIESEGGSLAALEANMAETKFTERRIAELRKRLAAHSAREG